MGRDASSKKKPAGIKDVAAMAGVSLKTVTNVVHERDNVSPDTRAKVQHAIAQLQYRPSRIGRQLQSGRSQMITLAVPRIDEPYLGALAHALIAAAERRGYLVVMDETLGRIDREHRAAEGYPGMGVDGVIFSPLVLDPASMAQGSRRTPIVLLGEPVDDSSADFVSIDNRESALDLVDHLISRGRRRFGFLGVGHPRGVGGLRLQAVRSGLAQAGVSPPITIDCESFSRESGARAIADQQAVVEGLDALVCASDLLAIGAMHALRAAGLNTPDQVAVAGWDNIVDGHYTHPSLTSIGPDLTALADTTITSLVSRLEGHDGPARTFHVPHHLVVREST